MALRARYQAHVHQAIPRAFHFRLQRTKQLINITQTTTLQYYLLEYVDGGVRKTRDFSPQDGDVKPDCPYVRELIAEELMWPIDEPDRSIPPMRRNAQMGRTRVLC